MYIFQISTPIIENINGVETITELLPICYLAARTKQDLRILAGKVGIQDKDIYISPIEATHFPLCEN